ncbi:fatty acid CoA ligase family protein [Candidatus Uabimicrobium amorphum]|uniref:Peptide synthase n=1 Tax=Uabimicrobium amorphum TaxID=2596890 RepID=A0A5S9IUC8_UABAM|nr:fatty acid CoA ligase family protein [Candidatus Uabimicrobium amorphum]BBM88308.1 peptide synthase [Candidatus Uabimicrobium amorphum]
MANIVEHLPKMANLQPDSKAVIIVTGKNKHTSYTFRELDDASNEIAAGLEKIGITRGMRTALMVKPSREFFSLTFALFKVGAVPVLIDPGIGIKNLAICLKEAQPKAFIGIPKAHIARILFGWAKDSLQLYVTVGKRLFWGGYTLSQVQEVGRKNLPYQIQETAAEDMAAILFTSGSTGVPKGAIYHHGNFCAQVDILKRVYDIRPGEVDLATFPLFALFGPALGMAVVSPQMDATRPASVEPRNIIDPVVEFSITNMFGSPALINTVARYGEKHNVKLPSLKRVISAGAPVPGHVLQRFSSMLNEDTQIFTPYGATESLPVCSIGSKEVLRETQQLTDEGAGVCVGKPVDEIEAHIIKISDEPIATWSEDLQVSRGEIGEIIVKGPQVTTGYFNRSGSNELSKITTDDGFFHRMGDLGYFDEKGRIWFCGRKAHRVVMEEKTLFTIQCEAVFNTHSKVYRTALVGVEQNGKMTAVLCVELEKGQSSSPQLTEELRELGRKKEHTKDIGTFLYHPSFPVDIRHNSKIFREKLAVWAAGEVG